MFLMIRVYLSSAMPATIKVLFQETPATIGALERYFKGTKGPFAGFRNLNTAAENALLLDLLHVLCC